MNITQKINTYLNEEDIVFKTENQVVKFVQDNTKYKEVLGKSLYSVVYQGKLFSSDDTRLLVLAICKKLGITAK
jgi:hypothetical protein